MPRTALGQNAASDSRFVSDVLDRNRAPRTDTVEKVLRWMDDYERGHAGSKEDPPADVPQAAPPSAPSGRQVHFRLDSPTPVLNQTRRLNHHAYARRRHAMSWAVKVASQGQLPPAPFQYARVTIDRRSVGRPDYDGVVGGCKALIDCLQPPSKRHPNGLGIIADDSPDVTELVIRSTRVGSKADQQTIVTIEELPGPPG